MDSDELYDIDSNYSYGYMDTGNKAYDDDDDDGDTYMPLYCYLGQITMQGFPTANLYWYRTATGLLRVEVQGGSSYPFDFDGDHTLELSMYVMACNLHRCAFAAAKTGEIYDESNLPGKTLEITSFQYMAPSMAGLQLHWSEMDVRGELKTKTWRDIVVEQQFQGVDIEFRYV